MTLGLLINRNDFNNVVNISEHCKEDDEILNQFIVEAHEMDLEELLGNCFYNEVMDNRNNLTYKDLINGSKYTVDGKTRSHKGLKRVLIHFSFGAYLYRGGMVDTPFSVVQKMSEDSIPVPVTDLKNLRDENRKMAYKYWRNVFHYLCNNKDLFTCFDGCDCPADTQCNCNENSCETCNPRVANRRRSMRIKVISK